MNKILVFTNAYRWNEMCDCFNVDETRWNAVFQNIENDKIYKCCLDANYTNILEPLSEISISEEGIYLVYDNIDNDLIKSLLNQCTKDNVYVLVHTHGVNINQIKEADFSGRCMVLQGMHDPTSYYYNVFDILTDNIPDKTCRIISTVFKPIEQAKRSFLYGCITPKNESKEFIKAYEILHSCLGKEVEDFMTFYMQCNSLSEYKNELKKLRDKIEKLF